MRFLILLLWLAPLVAMAETGYVTDVLNLGLHQAEDTSDRPFRNLQSGQQFEVMSRDRYYAHVQLPDGVTGYVKAAYIVTDPPAKFIVSELTADRDRIAAELEGLRKAFEQPAATISALEAETADLKSQLDAGVERISELQGENEGYRARMAQFSNVLPLSWVIGAIAVCLVGGFIAGLWWVDRRSRRRHGGIRIY